MGFIAVAVSVLVAQVVFGYLWYDQLFGATFLNLAYPGKTRQTVVDKDFNMATAMGSTWIGRITATVLLQYAIQLFGARSALSGAILGALAALHGECLSVSHTFFERRPFGLFLLHASQHIVSSAVVGILLVTLNAHGY